MAAEGQRQSLQEIWWLQRCRDPRGHGPSYSVDEEKDPGRGTALVKVTREPGAVGKLITGPCLRVTTPLAAEALRAWKDRQEWGDGGKGSCVSSC